MLFPGQQIVNRGIGCIFATYMTRLPMLSAG